MDETNEPKKSMSTKTALMWALPIAAIILLAIVAYTTYNNKEVKIFENVTIEPPKPLVTDITLDMCNNLQAENEKQNITTVKYYMEKPYCVWEAQGYNTQFDMHCLATNDNETREGYIRLRAVNITREATEQMFGGCNITQIK